MIRERVAIFLMVGDVSGVGGVERFYVDFITANQKKGYHNFDIITTRQGKKNILKLFPGFPGRHIYTFPTLNNRFSHSISCLSLYSIIKRRGYKIIHIANFDSYYEPLYDFISDLTKITLNIIDCRFAPEFEDPRYLAIKRFIGKGHLSGIYSWYKNAEEPVHLLKSDMYFKAASYCFTNYERFFPEEKTKTIVFAARLSMFKRPDHFVKAIAICMKQNAQLTGEWEFLLYGNGEMDHEIRDLISKAGLSDIIKTGFSQHLNTVLNRSAVFVSTQMYENFTSLSMLEAMASGNAIISYRVGQTDVFVQDKVNGILTEEKPEALAEAMIHLMQNPLRLKSMQEQSRKMACEVHNVDNFSEECSNFWQTAMK